VDPEVPRGELKMTENRSESIVQYEVLEYVWHSAKTFNTREAFRKNIRQLLNNIADNDIINFEKLLQDLKDKEGS